MKRHLHSLGEKSIDCHLKVTLQKDTSFTNRNDPAKDGMVYL